nr:unnamed protein product [Salmonella enterica subsp. enterica serovar Typhimurium]
MVESNVFSFICFRLSQQEGKYLTLFGCRCCMQRIFADLLQLDLTEKIAAVVKDVDSIQNKVNERLSAFNLQGGYFNSGVVFVNLKLWKENALTKKAFLLLAGKEADSFKYPDQDVLNILLQDKVIFLPRPYNTFIL